MRERRRQRTGRCGPGADEAHSEPAGEVTQQRPETQAGTVSQRSAVSSTGLKQNPRVRQAIAWCGVHRSALLYILVMLALVVSVALILVFTDSDLAILDTSKHNELLGVALVTIVGVMATGYIFLSESIRKIIENNEEYSSVAKMVQADFKRNMKVVLLVSTFVIIFSSAVMYSLDTEGASGGSNAIAYARILLMAAAGGAIAYILFEIGEMMDIYGVLMKRAGKELSSKMKELSDPDSKYYKITVNSKEYSELVLHDSMGMLNKEIHEDYDEGRRLIYCIRGRNSLTNPNAVPVRDMRDEFETRDILLVFKSIEKILCRIVDVDSTSISIMDRKKLESSLDYDRDISRELGMSDDIVDKYFSLREYRDCLLIYFSKSDGSQYLQDSGKGVKLAEGECSYSLFSVSKAIDERDAASVAQMLRSRLNKEDDVQIRMLSMDECLQAIVDPVLLLRFELLTKLDNKNLSNMDLAKFDFSYASMVSTNLSGSVLTDTCFYKARLISANLRNCDLAKVDLRKADCRGIILDDCNFDNAITAGANMSNSCQTRIHCSNTVFRKSALNNSTFEVAAVVGCTYEDCNIANSNFSGSRVISTTFADSNVSDSKLMGASFSECGIRGCKMNGSSFAETNFNNTVIKASSFINSKFQRSELMSVYMESVDFSNSMMSGVNYTGSQLFGIRFTSAQMEKSDFTRATLGSLVSEKEVRSCIVLTDVDRGRMSLLSDFSRIDGVNPSEGVPMDTQMYMDVRHRLTSFDYALLSGSLFVDSEVFSTTFVFSVLDRTVFNSTRMKNCIVENAVFTDALISGCSITGCQMSMVDFKGTSVTKTSVTDTKILKTLFRSGLTDVRFTDCDLTDTVFSGSTLYMCSFENVIGLDEDTFADCTHIQVEMRGCMTSDRRRVKDGSYRSTGELMEAIENAH